MSAHTKQIGQHTGGQVSPDLINKFLDTQNRELDIRLQEVKNNTLSLQQNAEQAKHGLSLHAEDRKGEREHRSGMLKNVLLTVCFLAILLAAFLAYAMYSGNSTIVTEVIKALAFLAAGGVGGYGASKLEKRPPPEVD
jgi:hypothetical protein